MTNYTQSVFFLIPSDSDKISLITAAAQIGENNGVFNKKLHKNIALLY